MSVPDPSFFVAAGIAVLLGAVVQSGVGLGLGMVAAPVLAFLDPHLMPGALLVTNLTLPILTVVADWRHIDVRGLGWALPARVVGTLAGAWVVGALNPRVLGGLVGAMVLVAVVASLRGGSKVSISPATLMAAGTTSGITGTATTIGGPPIALLYQNEPAPRLRGTLGAFFLCGTLLSLAVLAGTGQLTAVQVKTGLLLVPCVLVGFVVGRPLCRRISTKGLRTALFSVVSVSGVLLLARALL